MQFDTDTNRVAVTIAGAEFTVPAPFAEGHTLTAGEAAALNQLTRENVRNSLDLNRGRRVVAFSGQRLQKTFGQAEVGKLSHGITFNACASKCAHKTRRRR